MSRADRSARHRNGSARHRNGTRPERASEVLAPAEVLPGLSGCGRGGPSWTLIEPCAWPRRRRHGLRSSTSLIWRRGFDSVGPGASGGCCFGLVGSGTCGAASERARARRVAAATRPGAADTDLAATGSWPGRPWCRDRLVASGRRAEPRCEVRRRSPSVSNEVRSSHGAPKIWASVLDYSQRGRSNPIDSRK